MTYGRSVDSGSLAAAMAAVAIVLLGGCSPGAQTSEAEANDEFVKVVNVEVQPVTLSEFTGYIRLTGEVEALNDVTVSAEETGVIKRFYVEKGLTVRRGRRIAKISDEVLGAQVAEAVAAAELAAERFERQRQLWEDERIGSEIAYLEAKYQAELQAARVKLLQARLARTEVVAPISGIFDERYVDVGEMVSPGTRIGRIVEVERVKVTGGVAERFAAAVQSGDSARISFDVLPGEEFVGRIGYVGSTVDQRNRTFPIEIVIDNPGRVIKPRMVASVRVASSRRSGVVVVPQMSVMRIEDGYQVFVVRGDGGELVAEARVVRLGPGYANQTVVEEGLEPGDRLIIRGQQLVEAGDRVRIVNESSD